MNTKSYQSPLLSRYASQEMLSLFSPHYKHSTWRKLWVALAEAEQELGLQITPNQITQLKAHIDNIDFEAADAYEKQFHHDVMAHIHAYGDQCPDAKGIIHLGATSCYVTDNTDLIQMREALLLLKQKITQVIKQLSHFAANHRSLACLGYTHFQPAQLTTVGKRACMWIQDFFMDWKEWGSRIEHIQFLGAKGATGTQASFLALFNQNHDKVKQLDPLIAKKMGFEHIMPISGQTYTRKQDVQIFSSLASFAASAHKFATDIRLLSHLKEVLEPFELHQVGSSAMPYKRNPILCERICSLSRFVISLNENPIYTASTQWLERTLDDSANRRLSIPEAFLTADAVLNLLIYVTGHLVVNPKIITQHVEEEIPFLATENILMAAVLKGGDRQVLHEKIRLLSHEIINNSQKNDLLKKVAEDPSFGLSEIDLLKLTNVSHFIGRAKEQVDEFLEGEIYPSIGR